MKKKIIAVLFAVMLLIASASTAFAKTPVIENTEYEGSGKVEVEFKTDVQYKNAKVTVKDSSGTSYKVSIREKDEDDISFTVKNIKAGESYTYTISGVRAGRSGSYVKVSGKFSTPSSVKKTLTIKKIEYDRDDREIDIQFSEKVQYKSAKVTVKDSSGKTYKTKITEKDSKEMEVRVTGLSYGESYVVTVSGVRVKNTGSYGSVSKDFEALDD